MYRLFWGALSALRLVARSIRARPVSTRSTWQHKKRIIAVTATSVGGLVAYQILHTETLPIFSAECEATSPRPLKVQAGLVIDGLPEYTLEDVRKNSTPGEGKVWVTYKYGVYDITEYFALHPGGADNLSLAAGSSLEPYWAVFADHNADEVREILEGMRIGNIAREDRDKVAQQAPTKDGLYANDPIRSPILEVTSQTPFYAETPSVLLAENYITPYDIFFVRNHFPVPQVDPGQYTLEIKGEGVEKPIRLTLKELKTKFPKHVVTCTIQCAGNRKADLDKVKPLNTSLCMGGFIGTAVWGGARLRDVLLYAGVKEEDIKHVHFEGLDNNPLTGERYGGSVPALKAMGKSGDCLLAYEMNGEEIPLDHGYPVRAVVPGVVGARNIKWLATVVASKEEYGGFWQKYRYKGFSPSVDWNNLDYSSAPAIQELPVTSLITSPVNGSQLEEGETEVSLRGIAWSGGGREVVRVDVSSDGGETWLMADIVAGVGQPYMRAWAWVVWEASVPVSKTEGEVEGEVELCCKAVDRSYNVQPDSTGPIWNLLGYLSNAWDRIHIKLPKE